MHTYHIIVYIIVYHITWQYVILHKALISMPPVFFERPDPVPRISKLADRCPTAANNNECLFHRPIALNLRMSVNIDIRGGWGESDIDHK